MSLTGAYAASLFDCRHSLAPLARECRIGECAVRLAGIEETMSKRLKAALGRMVCWLGLLRPLVGDRAVIVLFHRISDSHPNDPITISSQKFERFVKFFARYFEVVKLSELLTLLPSGKLGGKLVITFDDGYLDNATTAAQILERHGLLACFFLATGYVGTDFVPAWDREHRIVSQWMSWDQARVLREAGQDIGSHTEHHVDLGVVHGEEARREITGGRDRLAAEMGESTGLFAHPFGSRGQMSEENNVIVKEIGLRCNLSAYGGTVKNGDDPHNLLRIPISNWFDSPYQFAFELVTGKLESS